MTPEKRERRHRFLRWYADRAAALGCQLDATAMAFAIRVDGFTGGDGDEHSEAITEFRHLNDASRIRACARFLIDEGEPTRAKDARAIESEALSIARGLVTATGGDARKPGAVDMAVRRICALVRKAGAS